MGLSPQEILELHRRFPGEVARHSSTEVSSDGQFAVVFAVGRSPQRQIYLIVGHGDDVYHLRYDRAYDATITFAALGRSHPGGQWLTAARAQRCLLTSGLPDAIDELLAAA